MFLALGALTLGAPGAARAADKARLQDVESALEREKSQKKELEAKAARLQGEMTTLRRDLVAAAQRTQSLETNLSAVETMSDQIAAEYEHKRAALLERRRQASVTLAGLERLARRPPESLLVLPGSPQETVWSAVLLRTVMPGVRARAEELRADLIHLAGLKREMAARHDKLMLATHALEEERGRLDALLLRKGALQKSLEGDSRATEERMRALAAEAETLRELLERVSPPAEDKGKGKSRDSRATAALSPPLEGESSPFSQAEGRLILPVSGRLVSRYGETGEVGLSSKGIYLETRPNAPVVAPHGGEVVFAGMFRGYGQLLIIAHGEGYHILLAGLSRIDSAVGQRVLAGEPVGVMGRLEGELPHLYMEMRHNGESLNPLTWMAGHSREKEKG